MEDLNHTSASSELNKKTLPTDGLTSPHGKNHLTVLQNGTKVPSTTDDDVFHHLAKQLSMIDNMAIRERDRDNACSKPTTPELIHSPAMRYSPDPAAIDLIQYSGIANSVTDTEAASNTYFEYHGAVDDNSPEELLPSEKRQTKGDIPSVLKATGVCMKLDYPRVKITGEKDIADLAGVGS